MPSDLLCCRGPAFSVDRKGMFTLLNQLLLNYVVKAEKLWEAVSAACKQVADLQPRTGLFYHIHEAQQFNKQMSELNM